VGVNFHNVGFYKTRIFSASEVLRVFF